MSSTSDQEFNAGLIAYDTSPLKQALLEFGQSWLVDALGPDLASGGVLSFVKDWGIAPTPQPLPAYPDVSPELKARMIAYAVALMANTPLSAAAEGAVSGYPIALPAFFRPQAADLALWSGYKSAQEFGFHDALRLWSRRVALSLYVDGANLVPWRLRGYPAWQVVQMLSWRPLLPNDLNGVMSGIWRGHSPQFDNGVWYATNVVWAPDPMVEHLAAMETVNSARASTPREALLAIRRWMAQRRALHGQQEWTYFAGKNEQDAPPGGNFENDCDSIGGEAQYYYLSMSQWLRHGWGGCPVSSNALALLMRSINVPAAAIVNVCVDGVFNKHLTPPAGAWSTSWRASDSVGVRAPGKLQARHACCYVFGAGLACSHGDFNVCGIGDGVAFGDDTLSGWLPWQLQLAMHVWAAAAESSTSSDDFYRRLLLADALRSAASDPDFAASFRPHLSALIAQAESAMATSWTTASPAGTPPTLREWIVAVSFWPVGQPAPFLKGMAALLSRHGEALPAPRWQPVFNAAFADTSLVTRQALARAVRELQTPMSGFVTTEPATIPREAYQLELDGVPLDVAGSVAVRAVLCALTAYRMLQRELPAAAAIQLLAAHCYDIYGLSERSPNSGEWTPGNTASVHARAFPADMNFWFQPAPSTTTGASSSTGVCQWESAAMATIATLDTGTEHPLASLLKLQDAAQKLGYPLGDSPTLGKDPLSFAAWGPACFRPCSPTSPLQAPLDDPSNLAAAVRCSVSAVLALAGP